MPKFTASDIENIANIPGAEGIAVGSMEIIYRVTPNGDTNIFLEDANAEKLSGSANPAFGGLNLDELYITNLGNDSVSRVKNVPRGKKLYHQV